MQVKRSLGFSKGGYTYQGSYEEPSICPLCKHALKPQELAFQPFQNESGRSFITALYLCKNCYQTFVTLHACKLLGEYATYTATLLYTEPNRFEAEKFDEKIEALSPQFVKIYNQALAAESSGLDEIAGLGYRKALEFLTKDFCIHKNPDAAEEIKAMPLAQCIKKYVGDPNIETLAGRSAWIGNDEAHYIRKQEARDVSDMKTFIRAMVYCVGMVLTVEDAASMSPA